MSKILVVDDSALMRNRLSKFLIQENHEVVQASDGKEGVEMYQKHSPDLAFMDITMPIMNGIEAMIEIRKHDNEAKVIILSAIGQKQRMMQALKEGAKNFMIKPFDEEKIQDALKKYL